MDRPSRTPRWRQIEWPTVAVAFVLYGSYGVLTWFHPLLPWWLVAAAGGALVAWHGSLQHEVVHGHPTPWPRANEALVFPSLWLWLPFRLYRHTHLVHHRDERLTDPTLDPESWYLTRSRWLRLNRGQRALAQFVNTAPGRLILGPPLVLLRLAADAWRQARAGRLDRRAWCAHLLGAGLVLAWTTWVCAIPVGEYIALYVYPGISLTLLRSFAEHQARPAVGERTVAVEAHPLMALLYLNNNLHPAHHAFPRCPWYRLPALWAAEGDCLAGAGERRIRGYHRVLARHWLRPRIVPVWPLER